MQPKSVRTQIALNGLKTYVHLGVSEQERKNKQEVLFDVFLSFSKPVAACLSDRLEDTICYGTIANQLRSYIDDRSFHLIEKLAWDVYENIKRELPAHIELSLKVTKVNPPVTDLIGGASFSINL